MKLRTSMAAAGTAAAIGLAGAVALPAGASSSHATHTLVFTSVQKGTASLSKTVGAGADIDVTTAGKLIGFDIVRFAENPKTHAVSIGVAFENKDGFLYGVLRSSSGPVLHGKVTGGTGLFAGAAGTITARSLNKSGSKTAVTITYHT